MQQTETQNSQQHRQETTPRFKNVIFDMDGTLIDSIGLINQSLIYATEKLGLPTPDAAQQNAFIGPPLHKSFHEFYGLDGKQLEEAIATYRSYYLPRKFESPLYPQIKELLQRLHRAGVRLAVASAKFEPVVKEIADKLEISEYFAVIAGTLENPASTGDPEAENDPNERRNKAGVVAHVLQELAADPTETCLIGDRSDDYRGAKTNHITPIGVAWGAGQAPEFPQAAWIKTRTELLNYLGIPGKLGEETMNTTTPQSKAPNGASATASPAASTAPVANDRNPRDPEALVRQFHEVYAMPISREKPSVNIERIKMRMNLILEEASELVGAVYGPDARTALEKTIANLPDQQTRDTVEAADALADLVYVIYGMALECGINLPAVLHEVQASNLSKLGADGKPIYREDGKVLKGPGFFPPNIAKGLEKRLD